MGSMGSTSSMNEISESKQHTLHMVQHLTRKQWHKTHPLSVSTAPKWPRRMIYFAFPNFPAHSLVAIKSSSSSSRHSHATQQSGISKDLPSSQLYDDDTRERKRIGSKRPSLSPPLQCRQEMLSRSFQKHTKIFPKEQQQQRQRQRLGGGARYAVAVYSISFGSGQAGRQK